MRTIIGVMGGGYADPATERHAAELGSLIASRGWVLLNGGRDAGVMAASARGARQAGGLTVGVLPDDDTLRLAPDIDIAILTGLGDARNVVNVLSSHVVIALRGQAGTLSEVAHALKAGRPVIALDFPLGPAFEPYRAQGLLHEADSPAAAVELAAGLLGEQNVRDE
jgi:hypothetical protein